MREELAEIIERSKRDDAIIVGSEVRMLGMEITRLERQHQEAFGLIRAAYGFTSGGLNTRIATYIKQHKDIECDTRT